MTTSARTRATPIASASRLHAATIAELQAAMNAGRLTSTELTRHFLQRIDAYDRAGPCLKAVLEVNADALEIAEALDRERASNGVRGPLHGVPVLLKDNIATADRMHTSAGSLAFEDFIAPFDAFLVTRLRDAGAVILGKANMTEWANYMTPPCRRGTARGAGKW
jgi:amidase